MTAYGSATPLSPFARVAKSGTDPKVLKGNLSLNWTGNSWIVGGPLLGRPHGPVKVALSKARYTTAFGAVCVHQGSSLVRVIRGHTHGRGFIPAPRYGSCLDVFIAIICLCFVLSSIRIEVRLPALFQQLFQFVLNWFLSSRWDSKFRIGNINRSIRG